VPKSHFTDEFKIDAVRQITERGYSVPEVSARLGVSTRSVYVWKKRFSKSPDAIAEADQQSSETRRLKQELSRITEDCDILKKATTYFAWYAKCGARLLTSIAGSARLAPCAGVCRFIPVAFIPGIRNHTAPSLWKTNGRPLLFARYGKIAIRYMATAKSMII